MNASSTKRRIPRLNGTQRPGRDAVLLVHGLAARPWLMQRLAGRLRGEGYRPELWGYRSLWQPVQEHAVALRRQLLRHAERPDTDRIHLVTHSMGGIVARCALADTAIPKLGRIVMLGPPNAGSPVAAALSRFLGRICPPLVQLSHAADSFVNRLPPPRELEIGVIAAAFDRVVSRHSTLLDVQADHIMVPSGHTRMLFRRDVAELVACFLKTGRFAAHRQRADCSWPGTKFPAQAPVEACDLCS